MADTKEDARMTQDFDRDDLRRRLKAHGLTLGQFASEAGLHQPQLSAILADRMYLGQRVRARLLEAVVRLGLDQEPAEGSEAVTETREGAPPEA